MEKSLVKEYESWCKKHKKDPQSLASLGEFNLYKKEQLEKKENAKNEQSERKEKADLVAKQKEIFKAICDYVGVDVEYDEDPDRDFFSAFDDMCRELVKAVAKAHLLDEMRKIFKEASEEK